MEQVTLQVAGMSCSHCVRAVEGALQEIGVRAKVDLDRGSVEVTYDNAKRTLEEIKEAIEEQGYDVKS